MPSTRDEDNTVTRTPFPSGAFLTSGVGSMPKPAWLMGEDKPFAPGMRGQGNEVTWAFEGEVLQQAQDDAVRLTVHDQTHAGLDIVSDGEQRRRYYVTHVTERLGGLDYTKLAEKSVRKGRMVHDCGRCVGPIERAAPILQADAAFLLAETDRPVKMTLPGPMTVIDCVVDEFYGDEKAMGLAVADALNREARALERLGVAVIQFDEPVFSRYPERAEAWGIEALDRACAGIETAKTAAHVCYGYPNPRAGREIVEAYPTILAALEHAAVDQLALEFEASRLDPKLLRLSAMTVSSFPRRRNMCATSC
jgi:5-methyltetrahydropteroyltriglutamate--homocysteine methyltransferase